MAPGLQKPQQSEEDRPEGKTKCLVNINAFFGEFQCHVV